MDVKNRGEARMGETWRTSINAIHESSRLYCLLRNHALFFVLLQPFTNPSTSHTSMRLPPPFFFPNLCSAKQLEVLLYSAELTRLSLHASTTFDFFNGEQWAIAVKLTDAQQPFAVLSIFSSYTLSLLACWSGKSFGAWSILPSSVR